MNLKRCWLTLNRSCNLRCVWCYASNTNYKKEDTLSFEDATKIIDICSEVGIKGIVLMGGEPTLYPHLFDLIQYINDKRMSVSIITNGVLFSNKEFADKILASKLNSITISFKGENREIFRNVTGFDRYNDVIEGIKYLIHKGRQFTVSMVLTNDNIPSYIEGVRTLYNLGVKHFHFSFCYEMQYSSTYELPEKPSEIIGKFIKSYDDLDTACEGNFDLFNGYPLCLWPTDFLSKLVKKEQITTVCQLLKHTGLVFDTDGTIIPCNAMTDIKIGKLNNDFNDAKSLIEFLNKQEIDDIYRELRCVPDKDCLKCKALSNCGGGCVCHWTKYSYDSLKQKGEILWRKN